MFRKLRSRGKLSSIEVTVSSLIIIHSEDDSIALLNALEVKLGINERILLILYYSVIYCAVTDRMLSRTKSTSERNYSMNTIIDCIKNEFIGQRILGNTEEDQRDNFEVIFNTLFEIFASCEMIMGDSESQIPLTASKFFAESLIEVEDGNLNDFYYISSTKISEGIVRYISQDSFKLLTE